MGVRLRERLDQLGTEQVTNEKGCLREIRMATSGGEGKA